MLDRTIAPEFKELRVPVLVRPDTELLPNGIEITGFYNNDQSLISIEFLFPAANLEAKTRQIQGYIFKLLAEGTKTKTSKEIADAISFLGASIEFSHHADVDTISVSCLSRFLPATLRILEDLWQNASFPQKEWKTIKETQARQNEIQCQKTSYLVGRLMRKTLYGPEIDYGYSLDLEWVEELTCETFISTFDNLKKTGPALVLCSGFADADMKKQLRDWLLPFEGSQKVQRMGLSHLPKPKSGILWEPREDSQQSSLRMGGFCINSQHPDSALFSLTMEIYGGYFGSRLMSNIREDKGWTYGIHAQRVPNLGQPYMVISSDLKGEAILEAVTEIKKEAEELRTTKVSEEELEKVKNYMIGQFLSSITNCYGLAERYRSMWLNGVGFERVENNQREIKEATAEQVLRIAQAHLQLDETVIALSGKVIH